MKKHLAYYLLAILCLLSTAVCAQENKLDRIQSYDSIYFYIASNVQELPHRWTRPDVKELQLSELLAVCAKDDSLPMLPRGQYVKITKDLKTVNGKMVYAFNWSIHTVDNYNYKIITDSKKPQILFYDNCGKPLENVQVTYRNKVYKQDSIMHLIRIDNPHEKHQTMFVNNNGIDYEYSFIFNNRKEKKKQYKREYAPRTNSETSLKTSELTERTSNYTLGTRLSSPKHTRIKPSTLSLKVTGADKEYSNKDYNYIVLTATTTETACKASADSVFVPPVLFTDTLQFNLDKELKYTLPQSAFPQVDIDYTLAIALYGNNNLVKTKTFAMSSSSAEEVFDMRREGKEIKIDKHSDHESPSNKAILEAYTQDEYARKSNDKLIYRKEITLPYSEPVIHNVKFYKVISDGVNDVLYMHTKDMKHLINFRLDTDTKDTTKIIFNNPLDYPVWYTIWHKNKKLEEGYVSQGELITSNKKIYDCEVQLKYLYAGYLWQVEAYVHQDTNEIVTITKYIASNLNMCRMYLAPYYRDSRDVRSEVLEKKTVIEEVYNKGLLYNLSLSEKKQYNKQTSARFFYKNEEDHKPNYLILVNEGELEDQVSEICRFDDKSYIDVHNSIQTLYVLSDSTLLQKRVLNMNQEGTYFYTIDMHKSTYSEQQHAKVNKLIDAFAEKTSAKIKVVDESGDELPGAIVELEIKGKNTMKMMTNIDGTAELKVSPTSTGKLIVRYIGLENQEIPYNGERFIKVILKYYDNTLY